MKTKNLILIVLLGVIVLSCQKNEDNTLVAKLSIIGDKVHPLIDENDTLYRRFVGLHYKMVNNTNDSVYLPIGYPHHHYTSVRVLKDFVHARVCEEYVSARKKPSTPIPEKHYFHSNDTIFYSLYIKIDNQIDQEWIRNVSTHELISLIELKFWPSEKDSTLIDKNVPNIIFDNDTTGVNINPQPIIVPQKGMTKKDIEEMYKKQKKFQSMPHEI